MSTSRDDRLTGPDAGTQPRHRKLLLLATEDWFVHSHFRPLIRVARGLGLEVVVAARVREHRDKLEAEGCRVVALEAERHSLGPMRLAGNMRDLVALMRREQPDIVHCIALRLVVLGGLAARAAGIRNVVLAPVGLGHLWIADGASARAARALVRRLVSGVLRRPGTFFVFENADDPAELGLSASARDVCLIAGSGVDAGAFQPSPEPPEPPVKVAVVARMTRAKGIPESIAAVSRARALGARIELHLFGAADPSNLGALSAAELATLCRQSGASWHGPTSDVAGVWREHHVALLLSHREGLPRSLVEAIACGRPVVATDVTGCRSVVRHGVEGLLVPRGNVEGAAQALFDLASSPALRQRLAAAGRARFLGQFTEDAIRLGIAGLYRRVLDRPM